MVAIAMTSVLLFAAMMLGSSHCYFHACSIKKERRAQAISSFRQSSLTTTNQVADANNQTDVEVVVDTVLSPPPYSDKITKGKNIVFC